MKRLITLLFVGMLFFVFTSCTENQRARYWGGEASYNLPKGKKLVVVTWKNEDMWYLVRDAKEGETPETYHFFEESSWNMMEGQITLKEQ